MLSMYSRLVVVWFLHRLELLLSSPVFVIRLFLTSVRTRVCAGCQHWLERSEAFKCSGQALTRWNSCYLFSTPSLSVAADPQQVVRKQSTRTVGFTLVQPFHQGLAVIDFFPPPDYALTTAAWLILGNLEDPFLGLFLTRKAARSIFHLCFYEWGNTPM